MDWLDDMIAKTTSQEYFSSENMTEEMIRKVLSPDRVQQIIVSVNKFLFYNGIMDSIGGIYHTTSYNYVIAGGSLISYASYLLADEESLGFLEWLEYSTLGSDIDLFFTSYDNLQKVGNSMKGFGECSKKPNAISLSKEYKNGYISVDLVQKYHKDINDLLNRFDINKSRLAISSDGVLHFGKDFDKLMYLDNDSINYNSFSRFNKYINTKRISASNNSVEHYLRLFLNNKDKEYENFYNGKLSKTKISAFIYKVLQVINKYNILIDYSEYQELLHTIENEESLSKTNKINSLNVLIGMLEPENISLLPEYYRVYHTIAPNRIDSFANCISENMVELSKKEYPEIMF